MSAEDQLQVMATAQTCVDNAISKSVRLPQGANARELGVVFRRAWELGLKGCGVYREDSRDGQTNDVNRAVERRRADVVAVEGVSLFDQ